MKRTTRWNIKWIDSVDSTNNEAKRHIESLSSFSVIAAHEQTVGRGQRGNYWMSEPYKNLTFSVVVKYGDARFFNVGVDKQSVISDIVSTTLIELLSNYGISAHIKLPNDIYVRDKKICGILIEHSVFGNNLVFSIIGVGLNVNQKEFDLRLPNPTSIVLENGSKEIDLHCILERLLEILYGKFEFNLK